MSKQAIDALISQIKNTDREDTDYLIDFILSLKELKVGDKIRLMHLITQCFVNN